MPIRHRQPSIRGTSRKLGYASVLALFIAAPALAASAGPDADRGLAASAAGARTSVQAPAEPDERRRQLRDRDVEAQYNRRELLSARVLLESLEVPATRPFHMGFTTWPFDFTDQAQAETDADAVVNGDLVLFHLDNGVPWPEAAAGTALHPHVEATLERMQTVSTQFDRVYVSTTAQAQDRATLAKYWAADEHLPLPEPWASRDFDDPAVIDTYLAWCARLIERFDPDYFAYGIEVNGALTLDDPRYPAYRAHAAEVHASLKAEYPDLPIFLTLQTGSFEATWDEQQLVNRELVEFSDYVGISTYPYLAPGRLVPDEADPDTIPEDWFSELRNLAPDKPFAITETGYIAEDLESSFVGMRGREAWQARYVDRLLSELHALDAEFVVWFVIRDFDAGWQRLVDLGAENEAFLIWRDTGLLRPNGTARPGMRVWRRWLGVPVQ